MYMKHTGLSLSDLDPSLPKTSLYISNMPKFNTASQLPNASGPSTSDKGSAAWTEPARGLISHLLSGWSAGEQIWSP